MLLNVALLGTMMEQTTSSFVLVMTNHLPLKAFKVLVLQQRHKLITKILKSFLRVHVPSFHLNQIITLSCYCFKVSIVSQHCSTKLLSIWNFGRLEFLYLREGGHVGCILFSSGFTGVVSRTPC